jgi:hypothetical protein
MFESRMLWPKWPVGAKLRLHEARTLEWGLNDCEMRLDGKSKTREYEK